MYISKEDRPVADEFLKFYEPYAYQGALDENLKEATKAKLKTIHCRFCKKSREETTFTEKTHLLSKALGNYNYYSHDECDDCNKLFGIRENDLARYFGVSRTFDHIRTDRSAPKFESATGQVGAKKIGPEVYYVYKKRDGEDFQVDLAAGKASVSMDSQKFRPDFVYLSLLKMALAIMPLDDILNYDAAFKMLLKPDEYPEINYLKRVCVTETGIVIARPFAQLFKKRPEIEEHGLVEHLFCLYVGHMMFETLIPGFISDQAKIGNNIQMAVAPYIQLNTVDTHDGIVEKRYVQNLWSSEPIKNESHVCFSFDTSNLVAIKIEGLNDLI